MVAFGKCKNIFNKIFKNIIFGAIFGPVGRNGSRTDYRSSTSQQSEQHLLNIRLTWWQTELGTCGYFHIYICWKNDIFTFYICWIWLGVGYLNRHSPEVYYFHCENGLKVTFWTPLQYRKPQMPSYGLTKLTRRGKIPSCPCVSLASSWKIQSSHASCLRAQSCQIGFFQTKIWRFGFFTTLMVLGFFGKSF